MSFILGLAGGTAIMTALLDHWVNGDKAVWALPGGLVSLACLIAYYLMEST
jgi:hypothetical protein